MQQITRRRLLSGVGLAGAATALTTASPATAAPPSTATAAPRATVVRPGDPRYGDLVRGYNQRWVGTPDHVVLVSDADQVVTAVQRAVDTGRRLAVRSGGHCYEDFVTRDIEAVIDLSELRSVTYDARRKAFAVEPGANLGQVYSTLFKRWGVTIPGGSCPSVGAGGHILGGGYGQLSRLFGLTVDHLHAVEVVVVDAGGVARKVVATGRRDDPHHELFWAHTGGGGGNFGVVTRYWMRSPTATGADPSRALPRPPAELWLNLLSWPWEGMSPAAFRRLLGNFNAWHEAHSAPGSPYAGLFSRLNVGHAVGGSFQMVTQADATRPDGERLLREFVAAVSDGVGVRPVVLEHRRLPWWHATNWSAMFGGDPTGRADFKSAYHRRAFTDHQVEAMYRHLTRTDYQNPVAVIQIASYGGAVNTVSPGATAVPQRDSILKLHYLVAWTDPAQDAEHLRWLRELYRDVYADTGGVPVPNAVTDGCFVNYADIDLSDPEWNRSGVPWHDLYYKQNYPRLRRVKARWDPRGVFRHAQSVTPARG